MSNNRHRECWWVFVFECLRSAEDTQGCNNVQHKRVETKRTLTGRGKGGRGESPRRYTLFRIPNHVLIVRRGEGSADLSTQVDFEEGNFFLKKDIVFLN